MKIKARNGREYYLVEVIAHILKFLKDELIKKMKRADWDLNATDFDWVITVPAIWRARGKQMMREAGYKVFYLLIFSMITTDAIYNGKTQLKCKTVSLVSSQDPHIGSGTKIFIFMYYYMPLNMYVC